MNGMLPELDDNLAALRAQAAAWSPPERVDMAVAAAVRKAARSSALVQRVRRHWVTVPLALAASILIAAIAVRGLTPHRTADDLVPDAPLRPTFTPIVPLADIQQTADAVVVPARVPRMTLAQYGLPLDPAHADDPVNAELLVRRDGAVLAYRFVE